ncbi:MAG: type I glyceraldehyde-3-phosphate dehydrogenase [Candidatus Gracilibacteria bacterium]|nr:type I glyceraldehyde-3-phosphate dehydrogenase [Candidatus Gracilibacteria bacterium]
MKKVRVAINGFGRIGRVFFRQAFGHPEVEIVGINNPHDVESDARLLKYDSVYGVWDHEVSTDGDDLVVDGHHIATTSELDPKKLPWKELDVDIVIEATGVFRDREKAGWHLEAGAKKVILSAPPKGELDIMMVMGVNEHEYNSEEHKVISNASCTTNSLAPVVKVLNETFGIKRGMMTTVHSYTNDQSTLDGHHRDPRRARAAAVSIIPTTTGAAEAVTKVLPELAGKLTGLALRVPTPVVSITDFVVELEKDVTAEDVNNALKESATGKMKGILKVSDEPLVSADYKGNNHSSIVDGLSTMVVEKNMVKLLCWYDNEWGYSRRLLDMVLYVGKAIG